jgi:tetratricopeptide (TPR) repeat protein
MKICHTCQQTYSDDIEFCPHDGARLAAQATETEAQLAAGLSRRFRIIRRLGQGGMGTVFLAEQIGVGNRRVALKVLNRKLLDDPEFLLRFQNEAGSTGRISHTNVVTIHESAQADDGTPYIAMQFLEGESLHQALKRRGALPVSEVAEILQQAARGLNAAHKLGIIHRDLKPDNIFLTRGDEGELVVKVVDFGIAKLRESSMHTQTGMVLGTPAYMSCEQASGMRSDELDARSDIYSLGVVVYEMLSGRVPFHSDTPLGYLRKHMLEPPPPFRAVAPGLDAPPAVESAVMKALAKDRGQRYASALDFARDFARAPSASSLPEAAEVPTARVVDTLDRERAKHEWLAHEKAEGERRERAAAEQERLAREKAEGERRQRERAAAELAAREKAERDRLAREKAEAEHREEEKAAAERVWPARQLAVARLPQLRTAPKPPSKMKFVAIAVVALILVLAGVWYFSPSANPPVGKPQGGIGTSQTGTGQQGPVVETPAPTSQSSIESGTNAADRHKQVEAAKRQGDNYYDNGEYDNAINAYQGGLKLAPSDAQLLKALRRAQTAKATEEKFTH